VAELKVLIVDDNSQKAREVAKGLADLDGYDASRIEVVTTANDAKRVLRTTRYDLVVLDIALPLRADQDPDPQGGLLLLDEVLSRPGYIRPRHFVGLTAFEDIYMDAAAKLGDELWSVVRYDQTSEVWLERIRAKARHIRAAEEQSSMGSLAYEADICIANALQDPELDAVLALPWGWKDLHIAADPTMYFEGSYTAADGSRRRVIAARAPTMGMPAAAILATKMSMAFRPRCLVMTGICAGNVDDVHLGDVIVAHPSWDYGSGKHAVSEAGEKSFAPSPQQATIPTRVRGVVERVQVDRTTLDAIRSAFPGQKPATALSIHIGPLASGAAVLADQDRFNEVKEQHRKLLGVDMEAYAVMAAAAEMPAPRPDVLVLKGVSDFANAKKDDRFRHYAAFTSARVLAALAEAYSL
jgi:nucleoside phosphorylase